MKSVTQFPKKPVVIGEYHGSQHVMRHVLWLTDLRDPGGYRQGISLDAFERRELHRPNKHETRWFRVRQVMWEWVMDVESQERLVRQYPDFADTPQMWSPYMPTVVHNDLLSFFEKIGYDRAKKTLSPDLRTYDGVDDHHPVFHELLALYREGK